MPRPWTVLPAAALCAVLALSGCTDDPEPRFADPTLEPTDEQSSTASPSPSPSPSAEPKNAPVALTPEQTVRAWVAGRNRLLATGDPADVEAVSAPGCVTCADLNEGISEVYAEGGYYRTQGWSVEGAKRDPGFGRTRVVHSALIFAGGVTLSSATAEPVRYDEERNFLDFTLVKRGDQWQVSKIVFLS